MLCICQGPMCYWWPYSVCCVWTIKCRFMNDIENRLTMISKIFVAFLAKWNLLFILFYLVFNLSRNCHTELYRLLLKMELRPLCMLFLLFVRTVPVSAVWKSNDVVLKAKPWFDATLNMGKVRKFVLEFEHISRYLHGLDLCGGGGTYTEHCKFGL